MTNDENVGGTNPSYKGYDYQKLVTVWVALTLIFGPDAGTDEIIVEPASHDDVKARLDVSDEAAESSLTIAAADELHVQIKFKGAGHWSAKDFAGVVNDRPAGGTRGPARRARAKALLLKDPNRRYVFITNTSVDGALAGGRVASPAERPDPAFLPTNLGRDAGQRAKLSGRFALIEQMTPSETRRRIDELLGMRLHVPAQKLDECVARLKRLVEDRLLEVPDPLRRSDIEKIAEGFGGLPHANPQLARYVAPANRVDAEDRLTRLGAVLLIGPSGYGKTLTAESIVDERRRANPPFQIVREKAGLAAIEEAFASPGRVLFYLDDPWGQSGLDRGEADRWTKHLTRLIGQVRPEKQFVVTSRSEIYREALGGNPGRTWSERTVVIDDRAYDAAARRTILRGNLTAAGAWRRDFALQHEARLLDDLRTPLELHVFTRELIAVPRPGEADLAVLVDRALTDGRKQVVTEYVRGFGDRGISGAAILWSLLRHSRTLQPERLRALRRRLDPLNAPEIALDDLADHLAQTQLDIGVDGALVAHGKVAEALEDIARTYPRNAETALDAAASAASRLVAEDPSWLDELQCLVDAARDLEERGVALSEGVSSALDGFLTQGLFDSAGKARRFRSAWDSARRRLDPATPTGRLVRWLARGASRESRTSWDFGWRAPKITKLDLDAVLAADPTLRIVKGFVAHVLPWTHETYHADHLLPWLKTFGIDLRRAFVAAGREVVLSGRYVTNADVISEGALSWPAPAHDEVWAQILELDATVEATLAASREHRRQAWQGVLDYANQLMIEDEAEDGGPSVERFAKGYVRGRRRLEGHGWISGHPRLDIVLPLWAECMRTSPPKVTRAELDAFFEMAGDDDRLQAEGLRVIRDRRLSFARQRISAALTAGGRRALEAAVDALARLEGDSEGDGGRPTAEALLLDLMKDLPSPRAAMLAPLVAGLEYGKNKVALANRLVAASGPSHAAVHLALSRSLGAGDEELLRQFRSLAREEVATLMAEGPRELTRLLLVVAAAERHDVGPVATRWATSVDPEDALAGVAALGRIGGPAALQGLTDALEHPDFQVRRSALRELAPIADEARRRLVLSLAADESAPVREAVAEIVGEHGWVDGIDTLLRLLDDTRDYARHPEQLRRSEPEYRVARTAARALSNFHPLPARAEAHVARLLAAHREREIDVEVHARLLALLGSMDGPEVWTVLGRALNDGHVVGATDENPYPIRYAAAWSVVRRMGERPQEIDLAPWPDLEAAAQHFDARLAAPALLALGARLSHGPPASSLEALRNENASPVRTALALSMFDDRECARRMAVRHGLLPDDHPLFRVGPDLSTDDATLVRWPISEHGRLWLASLAGGEDVEAVLLWMMKQRTGLPLCEPDFDPEAVPRRVELPVLTFAELAGME